MPALRHCPMCGANVESLIDHLGTPADEGCPNTPQASPISSETDETMSPRGGARR